MILLVVLVAIVVGSVVFVAVPKLRAKVVPLIREAFGSVGDVVRSPRRVVRILGGQLVIEVKPDSVRP